MAKRRSINQLNSAAKRPCEGGKRPAASSGKGAGTSSSTQETTKKTIIPMKEAIRVTAMRERAAQNKQSRQQHKRSSSKASPLPNKRKRAGNKPRRMSKSKVKAALAFHGITSAQEEELKKTTGTSNDDDEDDGKKRTTTWDTIVPLLIEVEQANTAKNSRGKHVWELPTAPFRRVMEEISRDPEGLDKQVSFEEGAVQVLKSISEEVLTGLLTKAMKAAKHRGRKTLMLKDLAFVRDATNSQRNAGDLANIMPMCLDEEPVLA